MTAKLLKARIHTVLGAVGIWCLLTLLACSLAHAEGLTCESVFQEVPPAKARTFEASHTTSQYIRDNAPDYWRWSKKHAQDYFGKLTNYMGVVIGDSHPGNFIYSLLAGKMRYFFMDIKDSGRGPFIVDVAREIMSSNAVFRTGEEDLNKSTQRMLDAYVAGLKDENFEPHHRIDWIFDFKKDSFEQETEKYVNRQISGSKFKLKPGMVEPLESFVKSAASRTRIKNDIRKAVETQIPGAVIKDFAYRPRDRGGSKNLIRYWALVDDHGKNLILEFKEIQDPAVAQWEPQMPAADRFDYVMKTLWGVTDPLYQAVTIDGALYWMRPKKIDVFEIPYSQHDNSARKFLRHIAAYDCYLLGKYHGKQLKTKSYVNQIVDQQTELVQTINQMSSAYIERLKRKVKKLKRNNQFS